MQFDESFLNAAPCFCFCTAEDGTLLFVNDTLCTKLGFSRQELSRKKPDSLFTIATRIFYQTHLLPLLKMQGYAEEIFVTLQTKNKEQIPVLLSAETKNSGTQTITVYVGITVNHRKKFEDELIAAKKAAETALNENLALMQAKQQLQQHTEQLDKQIHLVNKQNEELRQFNHVVTHDLQEPLRKLFLFTDRMLNTKEKYDQEKITANLVRVLQQMQSVTSGLQQYVWLTNNLTSVMQADLNTVLSDAQQQVNNEFPNINLIIQKEKLPSVPADVKQLQLLFYHLLSNAVKFRKPGADAHVGITASNLLMNKFRNVQDKYDYTTFIKIEIADDGIGFKPAYKDQVFDLFRRLHQNESGSGVGLALCKKIIENHNGNITINSSEAGGTTVTIFLPLDDIQLK